MSPTSQKIDVSTAAPTIRVIIVGGGIAGLTLANCLEKHGIDYVLLEKRGEVAPEVGASIGVLPNGGRILDQLGILDRVLAITSPLTGGSNYTADGKCLVAYDMPTLVHKRMGYPICFVRRQGLLQILWESLKEQEKVFTSKSVESIIQDEDKPGVTVKCQDGTSYSGDLVVGADGVNSAVVRLMREKIEKDHPGATKKDQGSKTAEYSCLFGISNPLGKGDLKEGWIYRTLDKDRSTMGVVGQGGRVIWFLFSKMDKKYVGEEIPRFTTKEGEEVAKGFLHLPLTESVTWQDIWDKRASCTLTCMEESQNKIWNFGRIVCIGDSVHKSTANLGIGGNSAIESAASLVNSLMKLPPKPTSSQISAALQSLYEKRHERANAACDASNDLTRLESLRTLFHKFMGLYVVPVLGDYLADVTCDSIVGAEKLDNLETPVKSLQATMPWDTNSGICRKEKKWVRALWALPLLLVFAVAQRTMGPLFQQTDLLVKTGIDSGELALGNGRVVVFQSTFSGIRSVDAILAPVVALYTPILQIVNRKGTEKALSLGAEIIAFQTIVLLESLRRGNFITLVYFLPTIIGVAYQLKGLALVAPLYFFIHYIQSPLENYHAADNRLIQIGPAKTLIPTMILSYIIPSIAMLTAPSLITRQWIAGAFWIPFPIYTSIIQRILNRFVKDTTHANRVTNPTADLPYLRSTYIFAFTIAAISSTVASLPNLHPWSTISQTLSDLQNPTAASTIVEGTVKYLACNKFLTSVASMIWILLSFSDLVKAKKLEMGYWRILGYYGVLVCLFGSDAGMIAMWGWRESILAKSW